MDTIYNTTNVIISENELICVLFDGRYDSIAIITPVNIGGQLKLQMSEPDGAERAYWLDRFGLLPEDELQAEFEKTKPNQRKQLFDQLKKEFEKGK
jgi:hypothetical protein